MKKSAEIIIRTSNIIETVDIYLYSICNYIKTFFFYYIFIHIIV